MGDGMSHGITILRRMEKERAREAAHEPNNRWYELLTAPSCPPDKRLHIRGGIAVAAPARGFIMNNDFVPDWICDFENEPETQLSLNFTNANYYLGIILCYYWEWVARRVLGGYDEPVFDCVVGSEVATATEAEVEIDALLNGVEQWYYYRMPLWAIVLKNDGSVGTNYAILPIDQVNRDRSYLYRDARSLGGIYP